MNLKLRLSLLDGFDRLSFSNPVFVYYNNNPDLVIGTCQIIIENGQHFGIFEFDQDIDTNLYFYYFNKNENDKVYNLSNLSLNEKVRYDALYTNKVSDMIV